MASLLWLGSPPNGCGVVGFGTGFSESMHIFSYQSSIFKLKIKEEEERDTITFRVGIVSFMVSNLGTLSIEATTIGISVKFTISVLSTNTCSEGQAGGEEGQKDDGRGRMRDEGREDNRHEGRGRGIRAVESGPSVSYRPTAMTECAWHAKSDDIKYIRYYILSVKLISLNVIYICISTE